MFSSIVEGGANDAPCQASDPAGGPSKTPAPTIITRLNRYNYVRDTEESSVEQVHPEIAIDEPHRANAPTSSVLRLP